MNLMQLTNEALFVAVLQMIIFRAIYNSMNYLWYKMGCWWILVPDVTFKMFLLSLGYDDGPSLINHRPAPKGGKY